MATALGVAGCFSIKVLGARATAVDVPNTNGKQQEPPPPLKKQRQRWQWSKGDGPGEYGGPPLDPRIRRVWGGDQDVKDPITSTDDYIWNKEWQNHLTSMPPQSPSTTSPTENVEAGFLSLNRSIALDRLDLDLSKELVKPAKSVLALQVEAVREGIPTDEAIKQDKPRWRMAPTRKEQQRWNRAQKGVGMAVPVREGVENQETNISRAAVAEENYDKIKGNLQLLTVFFGALGTSVSWVSYSSEVALSYGVGLLGSLVYIRMLGNSVDSIGQSDSRAAARSALGQPRLLVPVVLVMFFNRWNSVFAPEFHLLHLELVPILVGFFTYKAATVTQVFRDILQDSFQERDL